MTDGADDTGEGAAPEAQLAARPSGAGLPQPGTIVANRYRIEREIGSGGMAVVYAATQLGAGSRQVALKWLFQGRSNREERRRRFLREARAAGSIQHPNVVRVFDAGEHESGVYLVMELVVGESLTRYLEQRGKLSPREAVDLLMPALRGVAAAHKQGVVHRDLKPDNLIVCGADRGKPEVKVLDFGLSKLVGPAADSLHTLPGTLVGTPHYMAPEQADSRIGAVSERSDVYTLAAILYEALAGRRPFESETLAGQLMKLVREEPTPLRDLIDVPEDLADMIMWALARDPAARPRDIEEFARGLEPFGTLKLSIHESPSQAPRPSVRAPKATPKPAVTPASPASSASRPLAAGSVPAAEAYKPTRWLIWMGAATLTLLLIGLALRADDDESGVEPVEAHVDSAPEAPSPAAPQGAAPSPAAAAPAPALAASSAQDASVANAAAPTDGPHAAPGPARPALSPVDTPPPDAPAAPDAPARRKRSPGVADPWDEP